MKRRWLIRGALLVALLGAGGLLVSALGLIPIAASSGHWRITAWFLHFTMRRSVATHSLGDEVPPLDEPRLVLRGAGAYESMCQSCHGRPEEPLPVVPQAATPPPPRLGPGLNDKWDPEELIYIVKHGVKFTGMPAWPTQQRDDEVHAMVAFLRTLPELDAAGYHRLVYGDTPPPVADDTLRELARRNCAQCHGSDGCGRGLGAFPRLAGQTREYLSASLHAYVAGRRHSGVMQTIATRLGPAERDGLAAHYSELPACPPLAVSHESAIERGRVIAHHGDPTRRLPSCVDCHGPGPSPRNPEIPALAGQYREYLELQLELFQQDRRGGTDYADLMEPVAHYIDAEQIRAVAAYYASLTAAR